MIYSVKPPNEDLRFFLAISKKDEGKHQSQKEARTTTEAGAWAENLDKPEFKSLREEPEEQTPQISRIYGSESSENTDPNLPRDILTSKMPNERLYGSMEIQRKSKNRGRGLIEKQRLSRLVQRNQKKRFSFKHRGRRTQIHFFGKRQI